MLKIELIKKELDLENFSDIFYNLVNVKLPMNYLKRGEVYLCSYKNDVVGGYLILNNPPFRFIDLLPEYIVNNDFFNTHPLEAMYEVNGFFVINKNFLFEILENLLQKLVTLDKSYLLIFFDANNKKIDQTWQKNIDITKIYDGPPRANCYERQSHKSIFFGYTPQKEIENFYLNRIRPFKKTNDYHVRIPS